jgi:hypothetical protein
MPRTLLAPERPVRELSPGVSLTRLQPGGRRGPDGEVTADVPGGQVWTDMFMVGDEADAFQLSIPDIRLPANQYWPLHWHDCWIAVVILDGACLIGDWYMQPGDVLISEAELEYGPLVIGPDGCQMFEVFAQHHRNAGGYGLEFRDHPTLQGTHSQFIERSALNKRNEGRQVLPVDGVEGLVKGHLSPGSQWDLGQADDPDRGIMRVGQLSPGERVSPHSFADWCAVIVLDGDLRVGGEPVGKDDVLIVRPDSRVGELVAGPNGARFLDMSRTAAGIDRRPVA